MEKGICDNTPFINPNMSILDYFTEHSKSNVTLKKGGLFFPQSFDSMVGLLKEGRLKIELSNEEGENRLMWFLEKGCIIACFNKTFYQEAIALEKTEILLITKDTFFKLLHTNQEYLEFFIDQLYKKYTYCINSLITEGKDISKVRVYKLIQQLGKNYGIIQSDNSIHVQNFLTRKDMASITGVHRSNIIKYLTELEHLDIIKKEKQFIIIKQPQLLEELINTEE